MPKTVSDRRFRLLWTSYSLSAYGSGLGFGALPLLAVLVVGAGPAEVAALSAVGPAVGALLAVPLAPWIERRRKRPVMIVMDLTRFAAMVSVPVAAAVGVLGIAQLMVVSAVVAAAKIAFTAATGAYLKALLPREELLRANSRLESTTWSALVVGPPLGGAAIGLFGPVTTVVVDAVSYLASALGLTAIGGGETRAGRPRVRAAELLDGWRHLLTHPGLRGLYLNTLLVNGLVMATEPLLVVLLLRDLGFAPWQYGLAFAAPCLGGLVGSRAARRVVTRFGRRRVLRTVGALRAVWLVGLAFVPTGAAGLATVIAVEFAMIVAMSLYNPVLATYRLERTPDDRVARTLSAWSIGTGTSIALLTALAGLLAEAVGTRTAIGVAGVLVLAAPVLLPSARALSEDGREGDLGAARP
ncbi:MFS transporter [Pseudonocardia sp. RS11V-5]|uniref:MFS transporter n=1 Tax=Pseudonocardia terrae TaxID=2905831 RepID=UPI001E3AD8D4|nr:MFS transporter [Pseudonocardia terrae]MCE3554344.1 MFS transporter [Pseudonocardia terrae]